jgi:hypothetical protein
MPKRVKQQNETALSIVQQATQEPGTSLAVPASISEIHGPDRLHRGQGREQKAAQDNDARAKAQNHPKSCEGQME